jgi:hypothetical protein
MGTVCAWCNSILRGCATTGHRISHSICSGCLEELQSTLSGAGLRLSQSAEEERPFR